MLCKSGGNSPGFISAWHKNCSWECYFVVRLSLLPPHIKINSCIFQQKVRSCDNQNSANIGPVWTFNMGELEFFGTTWVAPVFKSKSSPTPSSRVIQVCPPLSICSAVPSWHTFQTTGQSQRLSTVDGFLLFAQPRLVRTTPIELDFYQTQLRYSSFGSQPACSARSASGQERFLHSIYS